MKTVKTRAYRDLLKGHKDSIIALHSPFGPNSGFLYSASADGFIRVWNLLERKIESKLVLSRFPSEVIHEESNLVLDMGELQLEDKDVKLEGKFVHEGITASLFGENCAYAGFNDGLICCWNIKSGETLYTMEGHSTKIISLLRISPGTILSSSHDKSIRLWDTMNGNLEGEFIFPHVMHQICFENNTIYALGDHSHFYQINYKTNSIKQPINFNHISIGSFLIHENSVIFGTIDSFLHVYDLSEIADEKYVPRKQIPIHGSWLRCMKKLNNYLFIGSDDKIIRVLNLKTFQLLEEFVGHEDTITCLEFADCNLFSGSSDHSIRSWDLKEMENRIWERRMMTREDIRSRKLEAYTGVLEKRKKRRKGKKGKGKSKKKAAGSSKGKASKKKA